MPQITISTTFSALSITLVSGKAKPIRVRPGQGIAGHAYTTRAPLNLPDAYASAVFNKAVDRETGYHTRSILAVPILPPADDGATADDARARASAKVIGVGLEHPLPTTTANGKAARALRDQGAGAVDQRTEPNAYCQGKRPEICTCGLAFLVAR